MKTFKKLAIAMSFALALLGLTAMPTNTYAESICSHLTPGTEVYKANGCGGTSTNELSEVIVNIITGVVGILGVVAAIFIVVGGVNYMTSAGDAGKLKKAKDTILYAVIGLIISVLAFAIVNFVIRGVIEGSSSDGSNNVTNSSNVSG